MQPNFFERDKIPKHNRTLIHKMNDFDLRKFIKENHWYQTFDFGNGIMTKASHRSDLQVDLVLPEDMAGMRYLDVGSNQGFQVLSAAMRGADAYGIDNKINQIRISRAIASHFGIRASFTLMNIVDAHLKYYEFKRGFNYITLMSVFHHFRSPFRVIQNIREMILPHGTLMGEYCCWVDGEKRWIRADKVPDEWGAVYHRAFPTVDAVVLFLKAFFDRVEVISPLKMRHRILIRAELK